MNQNDAVRYKVLDYILDGVTSVPSGRAKNFVISSLPATRKPGNRVWVDRVNGILSKIGLRRVRVVT